MPDGDPTASLLELLLTKYTGGAESLTSDEYQALMAGLLGAEKTLGVPVSTLIEMPPGELSALLGGGAEGAEAEGGDAWTALADAVRGAVAGQAGTEAAALALQRELGLAQLGVAKGELALAERAEAWGEKQDVTQMLLESAKLATGPAGAIQLAYLAREQGAPQEQIAALFQNLPFIQELLHGQNIPGFGLPEALGGEGRMGVSTLPVPAGAGGATAPPGEGVPSLVTTPPRGPGVPAGAIQGRGLGVTIPGKKSITRQAWGTLSEFEKAFLGALGESETGQGAPGFLQDIMKSFIPTRTAGALAIS